MNSNDREQAAAVLGWLADRFGELPESRERSVEAGLICLMAQGIVLEYVKHTLDGDEAYDALHKAARGELPAPEGVALVHRILSAKPTE